MKEREEKKGVKEKGGKEKRVGREERRERGEEGKRRGGGEKRIKRKELQHCTFVSLPSSRLCSVFCHSSIIIFL